MNVDTLGKISAILLAVLGIPLIIYILTKDWYQSKIGYPLQMVAQTDKWDVVRKYLDEHNKHLYSTLFGVQQLALKRMKELARTTEEIRVTHDYIVELKYTEEFGMEPVSGLSSLIK